VRGQRHGPAAPYPRERPGTIVQEAGWASGPVWTGAEYLAPPGFDPRTVQPVGSRFTEYATRPTGAFVIVKISSCRTTELYAKFYMPKPDGELSSSSSGN